MILQISGLVVVALIIVIAIVKLNKKSES